MVMLGLNRAIVHNGRSFPKLGTAVPQRGNRVTSSLGAGYLALTGWRFFGAFPNLEKFLIIIVPHTSNWDFIIGSAVIFALRLRVSFMVKHTLFWEPFGTYIRWVGAIPIDRRAAHGSVGEAIATFNNSKQFVLAITPEGTRKKVRKWKTGFYHIAVGADVPIVPVAFDYGNKTVVIQKPFYPTGNLEPDIEFLQSYYRNVRGKNYFE